MKTISVIIPVYNERNTLREIVKQVLAIDIPDVQKEIVIVDDCSTDGSLKLLRQTGCENKNLHIKILLNEKNLGKGGTVKNGIRNSTGDIIIIQDADLEYNPKDFNALVQPILAGKTEVVLGVRTLDAKNRKRGFVYSLGNTIITFVSNLLYGNRAAEYTGGYKVFTRKALNSVTIDSDDFAFEHELVCKLLKRGYKTIDIPIHYNPRDYHDGKKINWRDGFKILWAVVKYRFVD
jgi:glycosyltransferase involved in cell wall biosynthesis